ncbi:MAG TPA: ribonuclease III [Thermoanaerobaculia bacterium]|nr:ribonuclease III [Thermoanaerobaculia bacterium]
MNDLEGLEERLGHRFADRGLLASSLTHRSRVQEQTADQHYERLEFLGDAVVGAVAAEWLYATLEASEGELSKLKSFLVSAPTLAGFAAALELGPLLRLGVGEERSGGREKESLLADALEAVLGALYLDAGLDAVRRVLTPMLEEGLERYLEATSPLDPKTALQELLQSQGKPLPEYVPAGESGPDHRKRFRIDCRIEGEVVGSGEGSSKKRAEQSAAAAALRRLGT